MPHPGYWQQDVSYNIKATIDETTDILSAEEILTYYNNSPDTLRVVYFNLYNNAYTKDSYLDKLHKENNIYPAYGKYACQKLGTVIEDLKYQGRTVKTHLDNTILAVYLDEPILPGADATFQIKFKTYFDIGTSVRNRMKVFKSSGYDHFDGVHWYPRINVYDRKFGWFTDQHLGREFYGDYGTYNVELTFANDYVVDATGVLQNRDEVLPEDLRQKLDIKNFRDKPVGSAPSVITPRDGTKKTWKFYAENVHDFGFTADPTYRIGEVEWDGIKCISLAQEGNAANWQNAADYTAKIIQTYSRDFTPYIWPKIIVADARDGMEYPMMTLDGGGDPGYRGLLAHEVAHQWFYGMVGNNETYRAALDEGFTQFLTVWALENIDGRKAVELQPKSNYIARFKKQSEPRENSIYAGYLNDAIQENDPTLNTHSDDFGGAIRQGGGYRHVYVKTATMLFNLQYVLGDELFLNAMKHYTNQWKMAHPYFEDFRNSIINYTKVDLNWFFDQWLETTKEIDYAVTDIKSFKDNHYDITFRRKGTMQMPLDLAITSKKDSIYNFYIPNTWFVKKSSATILPKWTGWGKLNPTYTAHIIIPGGIKSVEIDTSKKLADINMLNNSSYKPINLTFDHRIYNLPNRKSYEVFARPDIWYNSFDGLKTGIHFNGNYMNYKNIFSATFWYNTGLFQNNIPEEFSHLHDKFNYNFTYKTGTDKISRYSSVFASSRFLDGLQLHSIGFDQKDQSQNNRFYAYFKSMYRDDPEDLIYLLFPQEWQYDEWNNTINTGVDHKYTYRRGEGNLNLNLKSSTIGSDYNYAQLSFSAINKNDLGKFEFKTRTFIQYGTGSTIPSESALYLAGANPEEMMENKYTRSRGFFPDDWTGSYMDVTNHFHYGGGLNLRGYAGYFAAEEIENGDVIPAYKGNSGASVNAELDFDKFFKFKKPVFRNMFHIDTYLFADAGILNVNRPGEDLELSSLRADAGVGTALTIQKWGPLQMVNPLTIRFDAPLFLNRTPSADPEFFKFRWIVGVSRAF